MSLVPLSRRHSWQRRFVGPGSPTTDMIVPTRRNAAVPISVIYTTTTALIKFNKPISGGDATGFVATVNALPNAVVSAANVADDDILVTWTTPGVATNAVIIDYAPGAWVTAAGNLVPAFQETGVIP